MKFAECHKCLYKYGCPYCVRCTWNVDQHRPSRLVRRPEGLTNDQRKYIKNDIEMTRKVSDSMDFNNFYVNFAGKTYKPYYAEIEQTHSEYPTVELKCVIAPSNVTIDYTKIAKETLNSIYGSLTGRSVKIKNVIFNPPATIVFWEDGTKTVVKTQNDEKFDPEKGITMAIAKKLYGNKGSYFNEIKKWVEKYEDPCPITINY